MVGQLSNRWNKWNKWKGRMKWTLIGISNTWWCVATVLAIAATMVIVGCLGLVVFPTAAGKVHEWSVRDVLVSLLMVAFFFGCMVSDLLTDVVRELKNVRDALRELRRRDGK